MDTGDIHLADLNEEPRRRVLVVSKSRFHDFTGRVLVAPEYLGPEMTVPYPWRVTVDGHVFAVDLLRSMPVERVLERVGRAPLEAMLTVKRAITQIV